MTRSTLYRATFVVLAAAGGLAACDDGPAAPPPAVASGALSLTTGRDTLAIGATATLSAAFLNTKGEPVSGRTPTWSTTDAAVATVSASGVVTAVGLGTATIEAVLDSAKATRRIWVTRTGTGNGWVDVSAAISNVCAVTSLGAAYCWGANTGGRLGDSSTTASSLPRRVILPTGVRLSSIAVGSRMACGLSITGAAYCWGDNANFGIGSATVLRNTIATVVDPPTPMTFKALVIGSAHACALNTAGAVFCWGINSQGALGNNQTGNSPIPVAVAAAPGVVYTTLAAASNAVCAVTTAGAVDCWGFNDSGQLGNASTVTSRVPVRALLPTNVVVRSVTAGANGFHFCAITSTDTLYCWGRNVGGQFGASKLFENATPVAVPLPGTLRARTAGAGTTLLCVAASDDRVYCRGAGSRGEMGNAATSEQLTFGAVQAPPGVVFDVVRSGFQTACALSTVGALYCWGAGTSGQIGNGASLDSAVPVLIPLPL
ncbi:Ig-like domain-containing protein [Gemmatimonas sp.]|uniref:Ig-like domain-containing protein n=1 Tax=Gemmatimonas sp. TaxID=1962908 RepID=UPI0025BB3E5B|nr:Ig-like domain-containing protein [Gemmatimonas sp.]MCA2985181.1 Ig-like domain-containing protein [Gemmatimonas sp.]